VKGGGPSDETVKTEVLCHSRCGSRYDENQGKRRAYILGKKRNDTLEMSFFLVLKIFKIIYF
jgi:hypothetical protein